MDDRLGVGDRLKGVPDLARLGVGASHRVRIHDVGRGPVRRLPGMAGEGVRDRRGRSEYVDAAKREARRRRARPGARSRGVITLPGEPDPDVAADLGAREPPRPDDGRGLLARVGRPLDALPGTRRVRPAVIAALEPVAEIGPDGEPHAAVRAAVLPRVDGAVVRAPHRELLAEERGVDDVAGGGLLAAAHREPATLGTHVRHLRHLRPPATTVRPRPRPLRRRPRPGSRRRSRPAR